MAAAWSGGVGCVVSISNSLRELSRNAYLAERFPRLFHTVGVHPHNASRLKSQADLQRTVFTALYASSKCIAIGECGLDYSRMFSPRDVQIACFRWHVQIAREVGVPLYLHCRSADDDSTHAAFRDLIQVLDEEGPGVRAVVHCFTGTPQQARAFIDRGFFLGITGWISDARRNAALLEAVACVPRDRLLVETDAPWLSVKHVRGRASTPADTRTIVKLLAQARGEDETELGRALYVNATVALGITCTADKPVAESGGVAERAV
jgi:TatD DNase family protein